MRLFAGLKGIRAGRAFALLAIILCWLSAARSRLSSLTSSA